MAVPFRRPTEAAIIKAGLPVGTAERSKVEVIVIKSVLNICRSIEETSEITGVSADELRKIRGSREFRRALPLDLTIVAFREIALNAFPRLRMKQWFSDGMVKHVNSSFELSHLDFPSRRSNPSWEIEKIVNCVNGTETFFKGKKVTKVVIYPSCPVGFCDDCGRTTSAAKLRTHEHYADGVGSFVPRKKGELDVGLKTSSVCFSCHMKRLAIDRREHTILDIQYLERKLRTLAYERKNQHDGSASQLSGREADRS